MVVSAGPTRQRGWVVLAVTASTMVVATSMTFIVAVLAPFILDEGLIGIGTLGSIPACYYLAASAASGPAGVLVDSLGGRRSIVVLCAVNAAALLALAASPGMVVLLLAALVGGSAMAMANPATNLVVIDAFGVGRRGAALGWKQAGVPLSGVLTGLLLPSLADGIGWRSAVVVAVAAPVTVALVALRVLPARAGAREGDLPSGRMSVGSLSPFAYLMGVATGALNTYLVVFAVDAGLSRTSAGLVASAFSASAAVSRIGWAIAAERSGRPRGVLVGLATLSAVAIASLPFVPVGWPLPVVAAICGAGVLGWQAAAQLMVLSAVPPRAAGAGSALLMRSFFAGLLSGPLAFGLALEVSGSYGWSFGALAATTVAAVVVVVVRSPGVGFVDRRPSIRARRASEL